MASTGHMRGFSLGVAVAVAAATPLGAAELNDYPTTARADSVIASILPYERYVSAETVLSLAQVPGRFGSMFRSPEEARSATNDLRRAQAEARVRCF